MNADPKLRSSRKQFWPCFRTNLLTLVKESNFSRPVFPEMRDEALSTLAIVDIEKLRRALTNQVLHSSSGIDQRSEPSLLTRRLDGRFWEILSLVCFFSTHILTDLRSSGVIGSLEHVMSRATFVNYLLGNKNSNACLHSSIIRHQTWAIWKQCSGGVSLNWHTACCISLSLRVNEKRAWSNVLIGWDDEGRVERFVEYFWRQKYGRHIQMTLPAVVDLRWGSGGRDSDNMLGNMNLIFAPVEVCMGLSFLG